MQRIEVPNLPANASAYQDDAGNIYRVHLDLKTPIETLTSASSYVEVETRGYLIDASGSLLVDDNLEPIMLPAQRARIPMGNIINGTDTASPGWVKQPLPEDEAARSEALKSGRKLKHLPKSGTVGELVIVDDELYAFSEGLYEAVKRGRVAAAAPAPVAAPDALSAAVLEKLAP